MPLWQVVVLGIVQGITEFLPISSTAHLLAVQHFFGRDAESLRNDPITVVIQLGTLISALVYFRNDLLAILRAVIADIRAGRLLRGAQSDTRLAGLMIIGSIPAAVAGLLFQKQFKHHFYHLEAIAIVAIVLAVVMALAELYYRRRPATKGPLRDDAALTIADALWIGTFQALALMPGGSRSGCTLTAALLVGLARPTAARFSFLLMLPILFAAGAKELYDWVKQLSGDPVQRAAASEQGVNLLLGIIVSAIVGYMAIAWLLRYLRKYSMMGFVIYRLLFGIVILIYLAM
jgi:undecaprenyl-diphosphatase